MRKIIIGIIILFLLIPYFLDKFIMGRIVTTMGKSEWFGFLGSYLGSGLGALLTLLGVYYQINYNEKKEKKEKLEGVLKYVLYIFNKNLNKKYLYNLYFFNKNLIEKKERFEELSKKFIDDNLKILFTIDFGKEIVELNEKIINYNQKNLYSEKIIANRKKILKEMKEKIKDKKFLDKDEVKLDVHKILCLYMSSLEIMEMLLESIYVKEKIGGILDSENDAYTKLKKSLKKNKELENLKYISESFSYKYLEKLEKLDNNDLLTKRIDNLFNFNKNKKIVEADLEEEIKKYRAIHNLWYKFILSKKQTLLSADLYLYLLGTLNELRNILKLECEIISEKNNIKKEIKTLKSSIEFKYSKFIDK